MTMVANARKAQFLGLMPRDGLVGARHAVPGVRPWIRFAIWRRVEPQTAICRMWHRLANAAPGMAFHAPTKSVPYLALLLALIALAAPVSHAQGSRKDDIVFGPSGHPVAGATVRVCQPTATGTPCSPLATLYTDATLTVPAANPLQSDGIGNYHFYAPAGRYQIQIT